MSRPDMASFVRQHAEPLVAALGLEVWGIEVGGGSHPMVRLFVEAPAAKVVAGGVQGTATTDMRALAVAEKAAESSAESADDSALEEDMLDNLEDGMFDDSLLDGLGVRIEQCAEISRRLGLALEVADPFSDAWTLEVSSPGFDRLFFELPQCVPYIGRELDIALSAPLAEWPGRKKFKGVLSVVSDDAITLELDLSQRRTDEPPQAILPWDHVRRARLIHVFVEPEKPGKGKDSGKAGTAGLDPDAAFGKKTKKRGPKIHDELD